MVLYFHRLLLLFVAEIELGQIIHALIHSLEMALVHLFELSLPIELLQF